MTRKAAWFFTESLSFLQSPFKVVRYPMDNKNNQPIAKR